MLSKLLPWKVTDECIRTAFYQVAFDGGPVFLSQYGENIINNLYLTYSTCRLYSIKAPITNNHRLSLENTDGLQAGDEIVVCSNMYGGAVVPSYLLRNKIKEGGLDSVVLEEALPDYMIKYSNGLIVLRRSRSLAPLDISKASIEKHDDYLILKYHLSTEHFDMECRICCLENDARVNIQTKTRFIKACRLYNLSLVIDSKLPINEVYLKNRKRRDLLAQPLREDLWLWKEGCSAGNGNYGWIVLHNPGLASVELITQGDGFVYKTIEPHQETTAVLNLEHYNDHHYRRHRENFTNDYTFYNFEDLSLPAFEVGTVKEHSFGFYLGDNLPAPPRFMLAPDGYRAVHVWTEHADKTNWRTQCAAYYGHEDIEEPDKAIGGFVKYGHVVTKSVFYDNPDRHENQINEDGKWIIFDEMLSYMKNGKFRKMLRNLNSMGHEICIHAVTPNTHVHKNESKKYITEFTKVFNSPTWIDHGMQNIMSSAGWQGFVPYSKFYIGDTLLENKIYFIWTWSSTDTMPKDKTIIDLLHNWKGEYMSTPLYWAHDSLLEGMYIWASHEADLEAFSEENIDKLIGERGVSIHQHYYPYVVDNRYKFGFIERNENNEFVASEKFNNTLEMMKRKQDEGELYITTIADIMQYWLDMEAVSVTLSYDGFYLKNNSERAIKGLALVIHANDVTSNDVNYKIRHVDDDCLVWFDMPASASICFKIVEYSKSTN